MPRQVVRWLVVLITAALLASGDVVALTPAEGASNIRVSQAKKEKKKSKARVRVIAKPGKTTGYFDMLGIDTGS